MPDARCVRSRACGVESTRVSHHGHTGNTRHSPRNGFNGFLRALPGDRALLPPSPALLLADLTPASGRQDHTTSPSASAPFVKGTVCVHRIPFRVDDVGQRPSVVRDMRTHAPDLPDVLSGIFFAERLDRSRPEPSHEPGDWVASLVIVGWIFMLALAFLSAR